MRPPHYAGENKVRLVDFAAFQSASMRPPHYAGENFIDHETLVDALVASMRPPHYAGENEAAFVDDLEESLLQ